jgi:molybdopterin-synthase adenylyltransferase
MRFVMDLTPAQIERYRRNILLPHYGREGQKKLCSGKVLIIGAGGLGSAAAFYLAAAGIGAIGIIDRDRVELSNLQRQILHSVKKIGLSKTESARRSITELNDTVQVACYDERLDSHNANGLIDGYDFIVDATDNFQSKFLINDICIRQGIPFSHAGVFEYFGQTMTVLPGKSACYRCVFQDPPADPMPTGGILGSVAGMLGTIQATEAIKYIAGIGKLITDALLTIDALSMDIRKVGLRRSSRCASCGIAAAV